MVKDIKNIKPRLKVYCVGNNFDARWLPMKDFTVVNDYDESDIVIFPGGADWNPALYEEPVLASTGMYEGTDKYQLAYALDCIKDKKFMIGICRGGQMLCILSGGRLIQHVDGHSGRDHDLKTYDGKFFQTNSIHHQMMDTLRISSSDVNVLGWTDPLSNTYNTGFGQATNKDGIPYREALAVENEILYFNKIGGFAIQGHPEMRMDDDITEWIIAQIKQKYEIWNKHKDKKEKPNYINTRINLVEKTYFDTKINNSKNNDEANKKNRNFSPQSTGHWKY